MLTRKRQEVENEADEVGSLINSLKDKLSGIDKIVDDEGNRVKKIKESRNLYKVTTEKLIFKEILMLL